MIFAVVCISVGFQEPIVKVTSSPTPTLQVKKQQQQQQNKNKTKNTEEPTAAYRYIFVWLDFELEERRWPSCQVHCHQQEVGEPEHRPGHQCRA